MESQEQKVGGGEGFLLSSEPQPFLFTLGLSCWGGEGL